MFPFASFRVQAKKWTEAELNECYRYIRDRAPILIHVNLDKVLSFLLKDTHYRNQFETGTSGKQQEEAITKKQN